MIMEYSPAHKTDQHLSNTANCITERVSPWHFLLVVARAVLKVCMLFVCTDAIIYWDNVC